MTGARDKPGSRSARSQIDERNRIINTKLTELQFYTTRERVTEAGLHVNEYVRQAVVLAEVAPRLNRQDADIIHKLTSETNNINQLAHRADAGEFALVAVELVKPENRVIEITDRLSDDWKNRKRKQV